MEIVGYSWLSAAATSPVVAALSLWTLYIFHTYRRRWNTVDLFLVAVTSQELVTTCFAFGFSVLNLIGPRLDNVCGFLLWGLLASRTFQVATLTSLLVDRTLTIHWPYRYRFSVRRNQIRYHIAVTAVVAVFVGVAAVYARQAENADRDGSSCTVHPLRWDLRYSIFIACLHAVMMLASICCLLDMEVHRNKTRHESSSAVGLSAVGTWEKDVVAEAGPGQDSATGTASSGSVSSGSTRPLRGSATQQEVQDTNKQESSRRNYGSERAIQNFSRTSVAVVALVCLVCNHIPYTVLTTIAMFIPNFWSPWHDNGLLWLRLLEGLIVPLLLYLTNSQHREAVKKAFQRRSGAMSKFAGDDHQFRLYLDDTTRVQSKVGLFGPMAPIGIITNYRRTPRRKKQKRGFPLLARDNVRASLKAFPRRSLVPSFYGIDNVVGSKANHHLSTNLKMVVSPTCYNPLAANEKTTSDDEDVKTALPNLPSVEEDLPQYSCDDPWRVKTPKDNDADDSHIYATLSDNASTFSLQSTVVDDSSLGNPDCVDDDDGSCSGSFITMANDDFEFHDTRPCGGEVRMRPLMEYYGESWAREEQQHRNKLESNDDLAEKVSDKDSEKDLVLYIDDDDDSCYDNPSFQGYQLVSGDSVSRENAFAHPRAPSLSMNDLDLIHAMRGSQPSVCAAMLPSKSESTTSLFKRYPSRSGTGSSHSQVNAFNPLWHLYTSGIPHARGMMLTPPSDNYRVEDMWNVWPTLLMKQQGFFGKHHRGRTRKYRFHHPSLESFPPGEETSSEEMPDIKDLHSGSRESDISTVTGRDSLQFGRSKHSSHADAKAASDNCLQTNEPAASILVNSKMHKLGAPLQQRNSFAGIPRSEKLRGSGLACSESSLSTVNQPQQESSCRPSNGQHAYRTVISEFI